MAKGGVPVLLGGDSCKGGLEEVVVVGEGGGGASAVAAVAAAAVVVADAQTQRRLVGAGCLWCSRVCFCGG